MVCLALILTVLTTMIAPFSRPAAAVAAQQCTLSPGAVVQLVGTPHLFILDEVGVLHWGGDTRGLAGKNIAWSNRCTVGLNELQAMPRGDPWLSSGLPKIGEPIYLSKWEDTEAAPTLLHIQSIADVELFGINTANYGNFVLDRAPWEQRYGFDVGNLRLGPLASAESFAWPEADRNAYGQLLTQMTNVLTTALFRADQSGVDPGAVLPSLAGCEQEGLVSFERNRNAGTALAATQECIARLNLAGPGPAPTPPAATPSAPTNVQIFVLNPTTLRLTWTAGARAESYRIYGGDQSLPPNSFVAAVSGGATTYDIGGRIPGVRYCYSVSSVNFVGESIATDPVCVLMGQTPGVPSAPASLRVSPVEGNGIRLDWIDTAPNEDGFRILRSGAPIATVGPNTITYVDFGWNPSILNCYVVVSFNAAGEAASPQVCPGTPGMPNVPNAPTNLRVALATPAFVDLEWSDNSNNEGGFVVLEGAATVGSVTANQTRWRIQPWANTAQHCYQVAAFNEFGQSQLSNTVCVGPVIPGQP